LLRYKNGEKERYTDKEGIETLSEEQVLLRSSFHQNKIYYSKHLRSISCCKSQNSLDRARNRHHLNLWLESML